MKKNSEYKATLKQFISMKISTLKQQRIALNILQKQSPSLERSDMIEKHELIISCLSSLQEAGIDTLSDLIKVKDLYLDELDLLREGKTPKNNIGQETREIVEIIDFLSVIQYDYCKIAGIPYVKVPLINP